MTYEEAKVYLEEITKYGSVLGLGSIRNLLKYMENPEQDLKIVHVAGTNGKGSVVSFLDSILREAGYITGCYTSPAVFGQREIIRVNGQSISKQDFSEGLTKVSKAAAKMVKAGLPHPTVFEVETALAFWYFKTCGCQAVLLETGLGGALDATNVVDKPLMCIFTPISMDHMGFLGGTLSEIARQKAGIIKKHAIVVSAVQQAAAERVLKTVCEVQEASFHSVEQGMVREVTYGAEQQLFTYRSYRQLKIRLGGTYQVENAVLAVEACRHLKQLGYQIEELHLRAGLDAARWAGRLTLLHQEPMFFIDGAHNKAAALALRETINEVFPNKRLIFIMGVFADKEYEEIARITAPLAEQVYTIAAPCQPRALPADKLRDAVIKYNPCCEQAEGLSDAVGRSLAAAGKEDVIIAFGSLAYLGQVREIMKDTMGDC